MNLSHSQDVESFLVSPNVAELESFKWIDSGSELSYQKDGLDPKFADEALQQLLAYKGWRQGQAFVFGKHHPTPRLESWVGDLGVQYRYSGQSMKPQPWPDIVHEMRVKLSDDLGVSFNSCLMNLYRNGLDKMGWHADNEPELGHNPVIASVSLGVSRYFDLKPRKKADMDAHKKYRYELRHGSLLVMSGQLQRDWLHQVPQQKKVMGERVNLTFRKILV